MAVFATIEELKTAINDTIYANDAGLITAEIMQERLHDIIDTLNSISTSVAGVKTYLESANDLAQLLIGDDEAATEAWVTLQGFAAGNHNHSGTYEPINANIQSHISSTSNPHAVSKSQVGLGNVTDNA